MPPAPFTWYNHTSAHGSPQGNGAIGRKRCRRIGIVVAICMPQLLPRRGAAGRVFRSAINLADGSAATDAVHPPLETPRAPPWRMAGDSQGSASTRKSLRSRTGCKWVSWAAAHRGAAAPADTDRARGRADADHTGPSRCAVLAPTDPPPRPTPDRPPPAESKPKCSRGFICALPRSMVRRAAPGPLWTGLLAASRATHGPAGGDASRPDVTQRSTPVATSSAVVNVALRHTPPRAAVASTRTARGPGWC